MLVRALLSTLHVLALPLGFASLFLRGMRLRELRRSRGDVGTRAALMARGAWMF